MYEYILLEPEQENLLITLVEAARNIPREKRQEFIFTQTGGGAFIQHPGLKNQGHPVYKGDLDILGRSDLLALSYRPGGAMFCDITPLGFRYYEYLKQRLGQPVQRVEVSFRSFLDAETFRRQYPTAYQKWTEAEKILWSADSDQQLTMIGHLCREAIQEFVTALVEQYQPPNVTADKAHTVARMKAVLAMNSERLSVTVQPFIKELLDYWGTVIDLIQRQEHGGQKEGQPLVWEDGRRVVFNTVVVMFEIDHALP